MASVTVDIQARVTGYEASIKQLQAALAKIDPGSEMGKKITAALTQAQSQVKDLAKNMFPKASSDTQIDAIVEKVNRAGTAIQNVVSMMQGLNVGDLNLGAMGAEFSSLDQKISNLQNNISATLNSGIQEAVTNSSQLSGIFDSLGIKISEITSEGGLESLTTALDSAKEKATETADALAEAEKQVAKLEAERDKTKASSPLGADSFSLDAFKSQLSELSTPKEMFKADYFEEWKAQLIGKLNGLKIDTDVGKNIINSIFQDLNADSTKEDVNAAINQLFRSFKEAGVTFKDLRSVLFGGKTDNGIVSQLFGIDETALAEMKEKFAAIFEPLRGALTPGRAQEIDSLISKDNIDRAVEKTKQYITTAYETLQTTLNEQEEKLFAAKGVAQQARQEDAAAINRVQEVESAIEQYKAEIINLTNKVQSLEDEVRTLKEERDAKLSGAASKTKTDAMKAGDTAGASMFSSRAIGQYKTQLEQIASKEQMLGKVQGVIQRWFSVYAVVRMVGKAFRNVTQTVKELDDTITEIAIVTDKNQTQLWDQMPQYTAMARKYGSSIAGVYKVSQLYYQQGLKQEDVMKLSEETLKMARISGLDYAQATDYMTNAIRSFKMEMSDAQTVVDVYSAVAAKSATSVTELATAMSKTASSAHAVGSDFQSTTAMMAVMIEATRESPENIGSALKSIISRYGELKTNKTGIDEEGEDYSLNKVDTALQSVGISIHDANGEFRDFDDVIMELSEHWNEIDKNTQRYIATVMAGNRQQSRFLALVSSGERLAELNETAMDSEDAATLQVLKTMDSIAFKSQQLQTSLQSLYTDSGIEELMKGFIDFENNLVKTLTDMPTLFNLPVVGIAKIITTFASLASAITTAFNLVKVNLQAQRASWLAQEKAQGEAAAADAIERETRTEQQKYSIRRYYQLKRSGELSPEEQQEYKTLAAYYGKGGKGNAIKSLGMNLAGVALTTISGAIQGNGTGARLAKGLTGIGGSALSMAAMGSMIAPGIGTALGAAAGAVMGVIENWNTLFPSVEAQLKDLQEQAESAKNNYVQKKANYKNLDKEIEKLEKLKEARYDSAEANEAFLEASNNLAASYPGLIDYIDDEGNAIVNLTNKYSVLQAARLEAAAAGVEASKTSTKLAEAEVDAAFKKEGIEQVDALRSFYGHKLTPEQASVLNGFITGGSGKAVFKEGLTTKQAFMKIASFDSYKGTPIGDIAQAMLNTNPEIELKALFNDKEWVKKLGEYRKTDTRQSTQYLYDTFIDPYFGNVDQIDQTIKAKEATLKATNKNAISNEIYWTNQGKLLDKNESSSLLEDMPDATNKLINDYVYSSFETWQKNNEGKLDLKDGESYFSRYADTQYANDYEAIYQELVTSFSGLSEKRRESANALINNFENYSQDDLFSILENDYNVFLSEDSPLRKAISLMYENAFNLEGFTNAINARKDKSYIKIEKSIGDLSSKGYTAVLETFDWVNDQIDAKNLTQAQGQKLFDGYVQLIDDISNHYTDPTERANALRQFYNADLTTLMGIDDYIQVLKDAGWDDTDIAALNLDQFKNLIPKNLTTELSSFQKNMVSNLSDFEKALSNASKGMDLEEAIKMADKLDISLTDFRQQGNKFFLDDYNLLKEYYFKNNEEKLKELRDAQQKTLDQIDQMDKSQSYDTKKGSFSLQNLLDAKEYSAEWQSKLNSLFEDETFLNTIENPTELKSYIEKYMKNKQEGQSFMDYMKDNFEEQYQAYVEASNEVWKSQLASSYLSAGNIKGFVTTMYGDKFKKQAEEKILGELEAGIEKDTKAALAAEGKTESASALQSQIQQLEDERAEGIVAYNKQMARATGSTISDEQAIKALEDQGKISASVHEQQLADINAQIATLDALEVATKEQQARDAKKAELLAQRSELEAIISDEENEAQIQANKALNDTLYSQYSTLYGEINDLKSQKATLRTPENTLAAMTDVEQQYFAVANAALQGFWKDQTSGSEAWLNSITEMLLFEEDGLIGPNNEGFYGEPWDDLDFSRKKAEVLERVKEQGVGFFWDYLKTYNEGFPELDSYDQTMSRAGQALTDQENALQASIDAKTDTMWHLVETMSSIVQTNDAASQKMSDAEKAAKMEDLDAQIAELDRQSAEFDGTKSLETIAEEKRQLIEQRDAPLAADTYDSDDIEAEKVELEKTVATTAHKQAQEQLDKQIAELKAKKESSGWSDEEYILKEAEIREAVRINNQQAIDDEVERLTQELTDTISTSVASGDMSVFSGTLAQFASAARKAYLSTWQSIDNSMITALEQGESYLEVTDANKQALMKIAKTYPNLIDLGAAAVKDAEGKVTDLVTGGLVEWNTTTLKSWTDSQWANFISAQGTSDKEKLQMMQNAHKAKYAQDINTISDFVSESDNLTFDNLSTYLNSISDGSSVILDITQDIMNQYGLVEDGFGNYIIKDYDKYIEQLKKDAEKLDVNSKAYQDTMRKIDSADRKHKHQDVTKQVSAFKDVISNYNEVSDDQYSALQEAFGDNWDAVSQILTDTGTGTYKLDVAKLKNSLDELGLDKAVQDAILQMFDDIADDYMKNITDATSMVTKGTTSLSDISKFKEKAAKLGIAAENAFTYDSILQAWTLDPSVLHDYVQAQAQQLVDDGYLSIEEATKYIDDNVTKTLAGAVDIKAFLDAEDKSGKARQTLIQSLKNLGVDERGIPGIIDTLIAGGGNAVSIMQAIAKVAGKELTSSEIESAYRAQVAQLESAAEQLEYGVGSLISGDAIAILQAADYDLAKLDDNNYIIKSIGDISKAYAEYYDKLSKTNEATLAALNEAKAKVEETKDGRYKEQKAIDALGDASGMTYTAFATILTDAGIEMTDEILATYTESLGGNKMRIKDFASFARMMKWDYGSEEYMSAFKTFNDGLIERKDKLKKDMTEELKGLENLKPGDWLNLTYTEKELRKLGKDNSKAIKENKIALQKALKETTSPEAAEAVTDQYQQVIDRLESEDYFTQLQNALAEVGAYFDDGILKLTDDANLIGVVEVLSEKLIAAVEEGAIDIDVGEIQDLMDQILSAYTDAIIKGIKGTLSHADASDLKSKAKDFGIELTDTDFSETTEGLKLSTKAATDLYFQVSRVNALKGKLVFDELNSSLKESDSRFQDLTSIMTYMQGLAKEINELQSAGDGGAGEKRLADAEKELALAKEIAMLRLTGKDEESFKILGKDTLAYSTQNAANYTQDVNTVATKADEWASQGYIPWTDAADFSDFTTHMIDLGDQSGKGVEMFGVQMGGKGGITKTQFQDAISKALTWKTDSKGNPVYALDNEVFQRELQMQISQGKKGLETTLPAMKDELGAYGDSLRGYDKFFADMDYLSKARKFGEFKEIDDLIGKDGKLHLEKTTQQFQDSLLASAENIKIGEKTLREAIEDGSANFNDPKYRKALTDLVKLAETTDWELESGYETIKEHIQKYGIEEEIVVGDFTYKMEGDHLLIKDNTTGEYITSDGTKCKSAEEALKYMNEQDIDDLTKELGYYQGKYESSGQANITLDGVEYTITINPSTGKIVLTSGSGKNALDGKEFSDTEEIMKAGYANYLEKFMRERNYGNIEKEIPISEAAWRLSQRNQDVLPAAYTKGGGLSKSSRAAFQKAVFNTWKDIQTEWNSMVDKYGQEGAALEWEAKYHTRFVPDDSGQMSDDLAKSYMDAINLSQAAADVAAGIDAAFQNEDVRKNIGKAITDGLTESMESEGTIEIKAPEIVIKPGKITIDTKKVTGELNGEVPTENVNVQGETPTPTTTTTTSTTVVNKTEVIDESATEGTESITIDATLNITNPDLSSEVNPNPVPVDIEFNPQEGSEITPPEGVPDAHGKVVYDESDIQVSNITGPDGHGKINYNSYVIQLPEITGPDGHGKIIYDKSEVTVSAPSEATGNVGLATGNARAAGTLMGELGPELVVQNGRYFVAGQNGAEFVDLANDAIVFNHLQTERLFKNGMSPDRGRAITNERVAAAFAHGNWNGGEAKADTSTMGSHYVAPLDGIFYTGVQAGYDAAGKKDGSGAGAEAAKEIKSLVKELEKWFNWLQQIAQLEKEITIEEAKRTRYTSAMTPMGKEYFTSQVKSLESLKEQLAVQMDLNNAREEYFKTVREELNAGAFGVLYEFDENFQPKYKEGMYEAIQDILYQNPVTGAAKYDAKTQYNKLQAMGLGSLMQYDKSGNKIDTSKDGWESSAVQAVVDKYEAGLEKGQKYHDDLMEGAQKVEELMDAQNQILKEIEDNQINVEKMVLKAIEDSRQQAIDNSQNERDAIEKSTQRLTDGLNEQLDRERDMYQQQKDEDELGSLQRKLAILQRSGGSASEIAELQQQIQDKQYENYFSAQELQIQAIQEASEAELARLDSQIELMTETLQYQKENGLLWAEVNEILSTQTPEQIADFIAKNTKEYWEKSDTEFQKQIREDIFAIERFKEFSNLYDGMDVLINMYGEEAAQKKAEKEKKEREEAEKKAKAEAKTQQPTVQKGGYTGSYNGPVVTKGKQYKVGDKTFNTKKEAEQYLTTQQGAARQGKNLTQRNDANATEEQIAAADQNYLDWMNTKIEEVEVTKVNGKTTPTPQNAQDPTKNLTAEERKKLEAGQTFYNNGKQYMKNKDGTWTYLGTKKASGGYVNHGIYELGELGTETVLTAEQTQVLRENILSNRPNSLISLLKSYNSAYGALNTFWNKLNVSTKTETATGGNIITIERAEVNLQIDKLANDYDSKRAANMVMEEMVRIAAKTKASNSVRR